MSKEYTPNDILLKMSSPEKEDRELIERVFEFAKNVHKHHVRYSGEPYFSHLVETAMILAELNMDKVSISAGLLHDSIEDGETTAEKIKEEFGEEILFLVEGVTKLGKLRYRGAERHNESLRKLFVATAQDIRVIIIKLADRLHNMRTLSYVPEMKRLRIANETMKIYSPLAYRLGIRKVNRELEDLAFKYINPEGYAETEKILKSIQKQAERTLEKVRRTLSKTLAKSGMRTVHTDYRLKSVYSLWRKLVRKEGNMEKIYDIAAIRVYVPSEEDCYKTLGIIHGNWQPLPGRIKDYIAFPKPNGYQSIHTTVFLGDGSIVEIQIRTDGMHAQAEFGIASHLSYKENINWKKQPKEILWIKKLLPQKISQNGSSGDMPKWIKELADMQRQANMSLDEVEDDFFKARAFLFTPKGDVVDLPFDSTPIDFAYAIHSGIGNKISGAKVNGKLVPISTPLRNGDIVEIIVKDSSHPTRKWLDFCKTTMAKKHIRNYLGEGKTPPPPRKTRLRRKTKR